MNEPRLIEPTVKQKEAFLQFIQDWETTGEKKVPFVLDLNYSDFEKYIGIISNFKLGIGIPDGFVPHTTFWLFDGEKMVGVSNLRHKLTDRLRIEGGNIGYGICPSERRKGYATTILMKTIEEAKKIGLSEVLVTCDQSNIASIGVIIKNGGIYQSQSESKENIVNRYLIPVHK